MQKIEIIEKKKGLTEYEVSNNGVSLDKFNGKGFYTGDNYTHVKVYKTSKDNIYIWEAFWKIDKSLTFETKSMLGIRIMLDKVDRDEDEIEIIVEKIDNSVFE